MSLVNIWLKNILAVLTTCHRIILQTINVATTLIISTEVMGNSLNHLVRILQRPNNVLGVPLAHQLVANRLSMRQVRVDLAKDQTPTTVGTLRLMDQYRISNQAVSSTCHSKDRVLDSMVATVMADIRMGDTIPHTT